VKRSANWLKGAVRRVVHEATKGKETVDLVAAKQVLLEQLSTLEVILQRRSDEETRAS
jgi:hypothetical protein